MKVFISSVRRGLEEQRDSLPGLIQALGHEPRRFEDYTAQPVPSREACLRGVEEADAYLLLLGPFYGTPLADTGKAPTEEEFTVAKRRGIPILSFRQVGNPPEPAQAEFISRVDDYRTGLFRVAFGTTSELLVAVAKGLGEVAKAPTPLIWRPLTQPVTVPWDASRGGRQISYGTTLDVHVIPLDGASLSAVALTSLPNRLARVGRDNGLFGEDRALDLGIDEDAAHAFSRSDGRLSFAGLRVSRRSTVSVSVQLPSDTLGVILDPTDIAARIAVALGVASELNLATGDGTVAVALHGLQMVTEGSTAELGRRSTASLTGFGGQSESALLEPSDQIPLAALGLGRQEIATEMATRLILRFRQIRR